MLELFRTEVETHFATLNNGLLALENNPTAKDQLEALMRAAHSIKGGARIVELEAAVEIAHIMEDCFVAAQNSKVTLDSEKIDILLKGADMLHEISENAAEGDMEWSSRNRDEIDSVLEAITSRLKSGTTAVKPEVPAPTETPPKEVPPKEHKESFPSSQPSSPEKHVLIAEAKITEPSLLEFFRAEVETHAAVIKNILSAFPTDPNGIEKLDVLIREIHAIEGGAQIVELSAATTIAQVIKNCFVVAQNGKILLEAEQIALLVRGIEILRNIARAAFEHDQAWMSEHHKDMSSLVNALSFISSRGGATPAVSLQTPPVRKSEPEYSPPAMAPQPVSELPETVPRIPIPTQKSKPPKRTPKKTTEKDRTVRVSATKIERLMGLAGEVVISARWLPPFSESLFSLKKSHTELFTVLEKLREVLRQEEGTEHIRDLILQARDKTKECNGYLADRLNQLDMFSSTFATLSDRLYHEVVGIRMRPFADGVQGFPRMVRDLARDLGKKINFEIIGKSTEVDRDILEKLDAPLTHLLRNAVDHGMESPDERIARGKPETGTLRLEAAHRSGMLLITVSDNGRGIDLDVLRQKVLRKGLANADIVNNLTESELIKFLFLPGFSTSEDITEISGRGVGLDVVDNMVHEVGGVVRATTKPGEGVSFYLELPLTLSVIRTFLVEIAAEPYAFPLARIDRCLILSKHDIEIVEDRQYFRFDNDNIALIDIHDVLELKELTNQQDDELPVVVISDRANAYGLLVDKFVGESDLVVRPLDSRLGKVPDISASAVMLDGSPILIFDVEDLVRSIDKMLNRRKLQKLSASAHDAEETPAKHILVVDDSITVREMERKLLENKGYQVEVAVDGVEGWNAIRSEQFDLVVSDVDMPRMNGIEFVTHIKEHHALKALPVIIVSYKDTEEHRLQGLQAGANYYLTKSSFQDNSFIEAVVDLIGEA